MPRPVFKAPTLSFPGSAPDDAARHTLPPQLLHDLRTPLHQIIGYAELLGEQAGDEGREDFAADLQRVRSAGGQLLALFERHFAPQKMKETESASVSWAFSEFPFSDSPFSERFLAPQARGAEGAAPDAASQQSLEAIQGRILVVDDNETNREVLSRLLEREGYSVESEAGGAAALERVRARAFDLILLDIMMPQMDGFEVLGALKTSETTRALPVIMISALGDIDSVVRCIEMGAEDYLPKPFNPTLLKARVGASLEKKRGHDREARLFAQLQENYGRLQSLETLRDDLTHMIVHDLRTPLSSLLTGLQTLPLIKPLENGQEECLQIALRGGFTLLHMINDLLDISKLESGQMELQSAPLDVDALINKACDQVTASARSHRLNLVREIEPGLPALRADEDKLCRTLVNLLGNAIKFTPQGGTITISAQSRENGTLFLVRDTGEGIPAAAFDHIFDKFAQVEARRAGRQMSTGLGLALCKMVVEAHNGEIWVESEVGKGSSFFFTVPASAA